MPEPTPANFSVKHAATRIGVGRSTVYQFIAEKRLRKVKLGHKTLIPAVDIERLIKALHDGTLSLDKRRLRDGEDAKRAQHRERQRARRAEIKTRPPQATSEPPSEKGGSR
jgi:excisionase family DNA binding protein